MDNFSHLELLAVNLTSGQQVENGALVKKLKDPGNLETQTYSELLTEDSHETLLARVGTKGFTEDDLTNNMLFFLKMAEQKVSESITAVVL